MAISVSTNIVQVTFKPNTAFDPSGIRAAIAQVDAEVIQFQIVARGRIQAEETAQYFLAGKDRFLLINPPSTASNGPLTITGTVDDSVKPHKLKILPSPPTAK